MKFFITAIALSAGLLVTTGTASAQHRHGGHRGSHHHHHHHGGGFGSGSYLSFGYVAPRVGYAPPVYAPVESVYVGPDYYAPRARFYYSSGPSYGYFPSRHHHHGHHLHHHH